MTHDHGGETIIETLILLLAGLIGWAISHIHEILGIIYLLILISFTLWKWRRDYKKAKSENHES